MRTRDFVHLIKYGGKDCISEHLRVLFPNLHSEFCDDAVVETVNFVVSEIEEADSLED